MHVNRILKRLLEKCSSLVIEEDEDGNTPLHLAALNGWKHSAKLLLEKRANIEARYMIIVLLCVKGIVLCQSECKPYL